MAAALDFMIWTFSRSSCMCFRASPSGATKEGDVAAALARQPKRCQEPQRSQPARHHPAALWQSAIV